MQRTEIYATGEVQLQFCSQLIFFLSICISLRMLKYNISKNSTAIFELGCKREKYKNGCRNGGCKEVQTGHDIKC